MKYPFTYEEGSLLIRLLIVHIIANFFLQTKDSIDSKRKNLLRSKSLWLHVVYVGVLSALVMGNHFSWMGVVLIIISHLVIDYLKLLADKRTTKSKWPQKDVWLYIIDQTLHIIVLIIIWLMTISGYKRMEILLYHLSFNYRILLRLLGYLIIVAPVTFLIKYLTAKWTDEIYVADHSLADAGKWIGIMERILVITFIFVDQYTAIGFLIAAKSILRLIDRPETNSNESTVKIFSSRKHTEYVLIGTFLSFGLAVVIGLGIKWLLSL